MWLSISFSNRPSEVRVQLIDAIDQYVGLDPHGMGAADEAKREKFVRELQAILRRHRTFQLVIVGMLLVLFAVLVVAAFLPEDVYLRAGLVGGANVSAVWCINRLVVLSRERLACELLVADSARNKDAMRELAKELRRILRASSKAS